MNVLLIRPFSRVFTKPYFTSKGSFSLACLSAFLKEKGHKVRVMDLGLKNNLNMLKYTLGTFAPHIVGVTAYTPNVLDGFDLVHLIKSVNNKYVTVMGGSHSTSMPEETLKECPDLDFVIIGEGEETLLDLCNKLEDKSDINQVAGLCHRQDGKIMRTQQRQLISDLDSLPFADRDAIMPYCRNAVFDHNLSMPFNKIAEVLTSRGCIEFCTFCTVHRAYKETGRSLRLRSAENVLNEISFLKSRHKVKHITFLDDSFTIDGQRIKKILRGLKDMRLSWNCDTRVNLLDKELIHEMAETGCKKISIGVESGSDRVLKLINKNISLERARDVFRWCYESKIETIEANFLIGSHPDETWEDIRKTRRLIRELKFQRLLVSVIVPFPGTKVREQMLERNLIFSNDWRRYMLMDDESPPWRTTYFSSKELKRLQSQMIAEFYFNIKNIIATISYLRSFEIIKRYFLSFLNIARWNLKNID